jgi:hypothetical protein
MAQGSGPSRDRPGISPFAGSGLSAADTEREYFLTTLYEASRLLGVSPPGGIASAVSPKRIALAVRPTSVPQGRGHIRSRSSRKGSQEKPA